MNNEPHPPRRPAALAWAVAATALLLALPVAGATPPVPFHVATAVQAATAEVPNVIVCNGSVNGATAGHDAWGRLTGEADVKGHCAGNQGPVSPDAPPLEIAMRSQMVYCGICAGYNAGNSPTVWHAPAFPSNVLVDTLCGIPIPVIFVCGETHVNQPFSYDQEYHAVGGCDSGCEAQGVVTFVATLRITVYVDSGWVLAGDGCQPAVPDRVDMLTIECYAVSTPVPVQEATTFGIPSTSVPPCLDLSLGRPICS
jgi:hypothetical protein